MYDVRKMGRGSQLPERPFGCLAQLTPAPFPWANSVDLQADLFHANTDIPPVT